MHDDEEEADPLQDEEEVTPMTLKEAISSPELRMRAQSQLDKHVLYELCYDFVMGQAPKAIHRLHHPNLHQDERTRFIDWLRNLKALDEIASRKIPIVSAGAGSAYWEWMLQLKGVDVIAFDSNTGYPKDLRYMEVETGGPEFLKKEKCKNRAMLLSWPDVDDKSTFGIDCVREFTGSQVFHVGELFGQTFYSNPWGQTTSQQCQIELGTRFRCTNKVELRQWPGHCDGLTVWNRVESVINFAPNNNSSSAEPDTMYCLIDNT